MAVKWLLLLLSLPINTKQCRQKVPPIPTRSLLVLVKEKTNMELAYSESPRKWPLETVVDGSRQKSAHCSDTKYNDIQALNTYLFSWPR